ncbi:hypothetical protein SAMN02745148_00505 [Modicisalibacter ilicicola DSM 19980]|uniref:Uncharacterized protein n=1 Tax=Modicisalibacter ilicicola DSM 19980 TaxID=1121942 RepID=A0A1M4TNA8_9GAMM|nr:hypothetical protein [Halomonas ilicicola]SHE45777.1 hypothetical protein SAMN02745148_00505 [Halomonas ilicicola DSM 19980]
MADRCEPPSDISFSPSDILSGLGGANRELLATCLALFDDSQWQRRLEKLNEQVAEWREAFGQQLGQRLDGWRVGLKKDALPRLSAPEAEEGARELSERQHYWLASGYSDDLLRLLLWIRLRNALGLPARLTTTFRGCGFLADDMAARLIHVLDPPKLVDSGRRWLHQRGWLAKGQHATTLDDVVLPILDELLEQTLKDEAAPSTEQRHELLRRAVASLDALDEQSHQRLLEETQANRHNDAALRNALLLGGSLGTLGVGVSAAGFSAYILAAQASAFIPLVSGPGLVSFVAVLSNPITILGAAGGGGWWFIHSAGDKVRAAVAARVMAMLTLQGKLHGSVGLEGARRSFAQALRLPRGEGISADELQRYRDEWQRLASLATRSATLPPDDILEAMAQSMPEFSYDGVAIDPRLTGESRQASERQPAAAMATLTVGDVLYASAAVDPTVVEAADIVRSDDIDNVFSFAEMAAQLLSGSEEEILGGISQLKGYVAEQAVAAQLTAEGHTVSLPEAANQPGWDLFVDGQPFQVKFHATLDGLREHFERYDYPVIANAELASKIPEEWADSVFFVEGLSNELVDQVSRDTLGAGVELLNPSVISIAGTISAARGLIAYRRDQLTGKQAVEQVLLDGMVRTGLAASGSMAGASVGMLLFGPAGALILGAGSPVLAQMMTTRLTEQLRQRVKGKTHRGWESQAHRELDALQSLVMAALTRKQAQLEDKLGCLPENPVGGYLRWRLQDDHVFSGECHQRLSLLDASAQPYPEQRLADTLRVMAMCGVHPAIYQVELRAVNDRLKARPGITEWLDKRQLESVASKGRDLAEEVWQSASNLAEEHDLRSKMQGVAGELSERLRRGRKKRHE